MTDSDLPEVLARVAEAAGMAAALRLAHEVGGTTIYVPGTARPGSALARVVGFAAAEKIVAAFGMGDLEVPMGPWATHARAHRAISQYLAEGKSAPQIARLVRCHQKTVRRLRRRLAQGDPPPLLKLMAD